MYAKADRGEIRELTGVSAPYEAPTDAELTLDTRELSLDAAVDAVLADLDARGLLPSRGA